MIENESSDSRHEFTDTQLPESMTPERILEPSAERAATRIEAWYPLLEPRLAKCLTDPNVVLTLSDARARTETYFKEPEPGDESEFHKLSLVSEADGIRFETSRIPGKSTLMINIENLAGYKNVSETTRLPGIPTFDPAESWEGVRKWQEASVAGVNAAAERGEYPAEIRNEKKDRHTVLGVMKGYPDAAIISMI